ncbi:cytochrome b5 [Neoconidiobolus thromboides FSU 785]|nr:cytochrome b5 [Neoconidiobolus thromboides FSU 785]
MFTGNSNQSLPPQPAPLTTPIPESSLSKHDGSNEGLPIYVVIKGDVFDVSGNPSSYGPGGGYHIFAGKDASYALATSSLNPEDCHSDISNIDEEATNTLNNWHSFFSKRYPIVGKVVKG